MKQSIKLSTLFLATLVSVSGCGETTRMAVNPITEEEPHYVTTTTHDVNIRERAMPFCVDGQSDFTIIIKSNNNYASEAALMVKKHIQLATGAAIPVEEYTEFTEYTPDSKYIVFGVDELSEIAGVKKTTKDIKTTGYQITTHDNSVFIFINHNYGYQQVAHAFLRYVIGYDRISDKITLYEKDGTTLPEMDIVEVPDFQIRTQSNKVTSSYSYETGFIGLNDVFYNSSDILFVHNSLNWVKPANKDKHPKWFAQDMSQICYTAHGDKAEYQAMLNLVFEEMKVALAHKPDCTRYAFTIEDNHGGCECDACTDCYGKYGAFSGAIVLFMNDLDDLVQGYLEEEALKEGKPKRKMELTFFAYNKVEKPPVKYDEELGRYVPTAPEMVCHENVSVYIAPIQAKYQESFYSEDNFSARETIEGWSAICSSINYWLYETNFQEYLYPYNTWYNMAETYRYTVQQNASYLFNEGQHNQGAATAFSRLKEYFNQVFEIDVNNDYQTVCDRWFKNYFGDGWAPMYKMFDEIQQHMNFLKTEYYGQITGQIYDQIAKSEYWPKQLLDRWMGYIEEAYKLINHYQYSDYAKYSTYRENILLESIFPRYAILNHHAGKYSNTELYKLRYSFIQDCADLGVTNTKEGGTIADLRTSWGV